MAMNSGGTGTYRNAILSKLSVDLIEQLSPRSIEFNVNDILYEPKTEIEYAYFPEAGVISVVSLMANGNCIEVGTMGREGMACSTLLLEVQTVPYRYFIQVAGHGHRVAAKALTRTADASKELRTAILRYEASFRTQTMQAAACNGLHDVEKRCCRWILMTRDRVDSDEFKLPHEFLALMLGVRRSSVTEVLAPLKEAGLLRSNRGMLTILNRKALEARVCECYWIMVEREKESGLR
jgi:CRP-like cAMP-binding protein